MDKVVIDLNLFFDSTEIDLEMSVSYLNIQNAFTGCDISYHQHPAYCPNQAHTPISS